MRSCREGGANWGLSERVGLYGKCLCDILTHRPLTLTLIGPALPHLAEGSLLTIALGFYALKKPSVRSRPHFSSIPLSYSRFESSSCCRAGNARLGVRFRLSHIMG